MTKPNNFPRKGQHGIVTPQAVERLEAERPTPNAERHYTIGGTVETLVHSSANAERKAAIATGTRRLQQSSRDLRRNFQARHDPAREKYIREQSRLAEHWRPCTRTPSR